MTLVSPEIQAFRSFRRSFGVRRFGWRTEWATSGQDGRGPRQEAAPSAALTKSSRIFVTVGAGVPRIDSRET